MVARNLDRGSGFLRPQLDTGPFPNLFLVEPPAYAWAVVGLRRALSWGSLGPAGRLVSALATTLGAWGLFGLVRRREGPAVALASVAAFTLLPVTIRYGRAFQPDAAMLGTQLAALRCWDEADARGQWPRWAAGWVLLATSLALKITTAYVLVPVIVVLSRPRRPWKVLLALAAVVPALAWYAHAATLLAEGGGSRASVDSGAIWLGVLVPTALLRGATYADLGRFLLVRAFTPLGLPLAIGGWCAARSADRLWVVWGGVAAAALALLAGKLHHEYYWLMLAPLVAVGIGRVLVSGARRGAWGRTAAVAAALGFVLFSLALSASTWCTPAEWASLPEAAEAVRRVVPRGAWVVAPEPLLFAADRRGCRLELSPAGAVRAAGEWGGTLPTASALDLVEFYRARGARFFADVCPEPADPRRRALHATLRRHHTIVEDHPGVLVVALDSPEDAAHADR
jgi:4-amino-4-deoxy-L-arabinose transferase-like glycosyltransferase